MGSIPAIPAHMAAPAASGLESAPMGKSGQIRLFDEAVKVPDVVAGKSMRREEDIIGR